MKENLDLPNLHNYVPLKVTGFDSNGFVMLEDIDGAEAVVLESTKKDMNDAFGNFILWHLKKAKEDICATVSNPTNDNRFTNGYHVVVAINNAIQVLEEERKFRPK